MVCTDTERMGLIIEKMRLVIERMRMKARRKVEAFQHAAV